MATLAAPKAVSPLIKFCRYAFFFSGIAYGHYRYNYLAKKEEKIQAYENKIKEQRAIRLAAEKEASSKAEMLQLAKDAGVTPKD